MAAEPHPDIQAILADFESRGLPPINSLSVDGARQLLEDVFDPPETPEPVGSVREFTIDGPAGDLPVRIYTPDGQTPFPVLVYFHGGGWALGSLETHDATCRALTNAAECVVVSVDYRLAPEHPFPAGVEDCYAAVRWVAEHPGAVHGAPDQIAVGGDSAGGNLAAAVAQVARDFDGPDLTHQVLMYPVTDYSFDTTSYEENAEGYFLTRAYMEYFWDHYLQSDLDGQNPYASPLRARDLEGLPPATVLTAGFDPLCDDGIAYADRLESAGVSVAHRNYDDMIHGFASMLNLDVARQAVENVGRDLQGSFET